MTRKTTKNDTKNAIAALQAQIDSIPENTRVTWKLAENTSTGEIALWRTGTADDLIDLGDPRAAECPKGVGDLASAYLASKIVTLILADAREILGSGMPHLREPRRDPPKSAKILTRHAGQTWVNIGGAARYEIDRAVIASAAMSEIIAALGATASAAKRRGDTAKQSAADRAAGAAKQAPSVDAPTDS